MLHSIHTDTGTHPRKKQQQQTQTTERMLPFCLLLVVHVDRWSILKHLLCLVEKTAQHYCTELKSHTHTKGQIHHFPGGEKKKKNHNEECWKQHTRICWPHSTTALNLNHTHKQKVKRIIFLVRKNYFHNEESWRQHTKICCSLIHHQPPPFSRPKP